MKRLLPLLLLLLLCSTQADGALIFGGGGGGSTLPTPGDDGDCLTADTGSWVSAACPTSGAPTTPPYWTGAADATLSAEHNLGALGTGLVINTAGTPSIYAGASCTNQVLRVLGASGAGTCVTITSAYVDTSIATAASGGVELSAGTVRGAIDGRADTGTTDTILSTDRGKLVTWSDADPVAVTLPEGTGDFGDKFYFIGKNGGVGTVTITPTTSTINGAADLDLTTDQWAVIVSDGTNYTAAVMNGLTAEADTIQTVCARDCTITADENSKFEIRGTGGQSTSGWNLYMHSNGTPTIECVISGVVGDCDKIFLIDAGNKFEIQNSSGTPKFTLTETTGAITNATIDGEGTGNTITLTEEQWFDAAACQAGTPSHIWNTPSSNAPAATCDPTNTNAIKAYLAFDDTTDESIYGSWTLPTGFSASAGIDIKFKWKGANTTNAAGWCFEMVRVPDGATSDPAMPGQAAGNCVSDTAKGTTLQENDATITGATCTSCVAGDRVNWRLSRDANGGAVTDSFVGDGFLIAFGRIWRVAH